MVPHKNFPSATGEKLGTTIITVTGDCTRHRAAQTTRQLRSRYYAMKDSNRGTRAQREDRSTYIRALLEENPQQKEAVSSIQAHNADCMQRSRSAMRAPGQPFTKPWHIKPELNPKPTHRNGSKSQNSDTASLGARIPTNVATHGETPNLDAALQS